MTLATALSRLRAAYVVSLAADFEALHGLQAQIQAGIAAPEDWQVLRELAHRMAGTAPSIGLVMLGETAAAVDQLFREGDSDGGLPAAVSRWHRQLSLDAGVC